MIKLSDKIFLKTLIHNAIEKCISPSDFSKLIRYLRQFIHNYLFTNKQTILKQISDFGLDIDDVNIEVLSELFKKDSKEDFYLLKNFIDSFNMNFDEINVNDFFRAFMGLLREIINKTISKIYVQYDPITAKIYRNISNNLPNEKLDIIYLCKVKYIKVKLSYNDHLPYVDYDTIKNIFFSYNPSSNNIPSLLEHLFECLNSLDNVRKEIKFNDVLLLFKEFYISKNYDYYEMDDENDIIISHRNLLSEIDLKILKDKCMLIIEGKIYEYLRKNRFTIEESKAIYLTMNDILSDIIHNGGVQDCFYKYLNKYLSISEEDYTLHYKTKLEYLSKISRKQIINFLRY